MFWLEYEMQLGCLLNLFLYKAFITLLASRFVLAPLCCGALFLLIQRWKLVLICCAAGRGSCLLAPGQQLNHSCACGWRMTSRCSWSFLAVYSNLKYVKVSMCVPKHSLCLLLPSNTYFPHNTDFCVMKFFHQLQWERGLRQHNFSISLLSFSLSGGTSSFIS